MNSSRLEFKTEKIPVGEEPEKTDNREKDQHVVNAGTGCPVPLDPRQENVEDDNKSHGSRGKREVFLRAFLVVLCLLEGRVYLELDGLEISGNLCRFLSH
ncbi:MAG: hypothetical protein JRF06_05535 [Deltaproteobacteria bacterium]|nr:hypothetical protein [Deltaproteobacteria bacterium]